MKVFANKKLVVAAAVASLLLFGCGKRAHEISAAEEGASTASVKDASSPEEAGSRMEIEIKGVKTAFRWAPPGKFTRRLTKATKRYWETPDPEGDENWEDKNFEITLTQGFWLAETETTQELWQTVMGENPSCGFRNKKAPVNNVSWDDVQAFISKLNEDGYAPDGYEFRLPTEAQWEYACMAGTTGERYGELDAIAWHGGNSRDQAHEVGTKQANAWGLYDMLGNVWEWCEDWFGDYPMKNLTDYAGLSDGLDRAFRGGSWTDDAEACCRSCRNRFIEGDGDGYVGFRLCLVPAV